MSKKTPTIISGVLYTDDENTTGIRLNEPAWSAWLEDAKSFYYRSEQGSFSANKQRDGNEFYWYARKRIAGRLYKRYLGPRQKLTPERLAAMATTFAGMITNEGR